MTDFDLVTGEQRTPARATVSPPRPAPDWASLPELIESTLTASLLGVKPQSLRMYVKRKQLAEPVQRGDNMSWYRREDVQAAWERRQLKSLLPATKPVQGEQHAPERPQLPALLADDDGPLGAELVKLTQPLYLQIQQQRETLTGQAADLRDNAATIRALAAQVVALNEQIAAERERTDTARREAEQARAAAEQARNDAEQTAKQPRTWLQKLLTRRG